VGGGLKSGGGVDWPLSLLPQQTIFSSLLTAQVWAAPAGEI
jgi:hypothetical protein